MGSRAPQLAAVPARRLLRLQRHGCLKQVDVNLVLVARPGRRPGRLSLSAWTAPGPRAVGDGPCRGALHRHALQLLPGPVQLSAPITGWCGRSSRAVGRRRQRRRRAAGRQQDRAGHPFFPAISPQQDSGGGGRGSGIGVATIVMLGGVSAIMQAWRQLHAIVLGMLVGSRRGAGRPRRVPDEAGRRGQRLVAARSRATAASSTGSTRSFSPRSWSTST